MSYDILAFDPASTSDAEFAEWWDSQSQWNEDHSYDNAEVTTPALRAFLLALSQTFPPMNGPDAPTDEQIDGDSELESRLTDYTIGSNLVYAAFAWSQADAAAALFGKLATEHGVAVAWVSQDPLVISRPGATVGGRTPRRWPWSRG